MVAALHRPAPGAVRPDGPLGGNDPRQSTLGHGFRRVRDLERGPRRLDVGLGARTDRLRGTRSADSEQLPAPADHDPAPGARRRGSARSASGAGASRRRVDRGGDGGEGISGAAACVLGAPAPLASAGHRHRGRDHLDCRSHAAVRGRRRDRRGPGLDPAQRSGRRRGRPPHAEARAPRIRHGRLARCDHCRRVDHRRRRGVRAAPPGAARGRARRHRHGHAPRRAAFADRVVLLLRAAVPGVGRRPARPHCRRSTLVARRARARRCTRVRPARPAELSHLLGVHPRKQRHVGGAHPARVAADAAARSRARMAGLTSGERRTLLAVGVLYAAVVIPIGIHKGGDFTQELGQSERLLHGLPLYDANPEKGIWWPPFTALGLVPFALVARSSLAVAKACWAVLNVCCLGWALLLARRWTTGWRPIALAVAAVGKPLQSNFEHLNVTPILLALIVATAAELEHRREARAGGWLGVATAIKGFPALVFLYFLVRRRWRALAAGLAAAMALTVAAMLPYGPVGAVESLVRWLRLSQQGTTLGRMGTQSPAGILTSGILTLGLYPSWLWFIGQANYTWGSLLLLAALVIERVRRPVPVPSPT